MRVASRLRALSVGLAAATMIVSAGGCGSIEPEAATGADSVANPQTPVPGAGTSPGSAGSDQSFSTEDAASPPAAKGYGLCNIIEGSACYPDDDGTEVPRRNDIGRCPGVGTIADPSDAGGEADGNHVQKQAVSACRLTAEGGTLAPQCLPSTPTGTDGVACKSGADCATGFDCVAGAKESVCRHYCCSGTCDGAMTQNGGPTFCDVRRLLDTGRKAPVCMPLKRCALLDPKSCSPDETCAITESGMAGCVTVGSVGPGQACDADHCASGLTCLGAPGSRKCYELCRIDAPTCPAEQTCKASALFKDPAFGVCGGS